MVLKRADEVQKQEEGGPESKAPHGDSSDEEDELLAENLRKATSAVTHTPRRGRRNE